MAKRIKRLASIIDKLQTSKSMRLSAMQDIGGCRAVMGNINHLDQIRQNYKHGASRHELCEENDYISKPKLTGYRGIHLIYKYAGTKMEFHGLKIEIQLRTANQHAWATAVETVAFFTRNALKSNKGSQQWLRFFALMGSAIARMEGCKSVPGTPGDPRAQLAGGDASGTIGGGNGTFWLCRQRTPIARGQNWKSM